MPIEFACACGKKFKVPDGYAGKRSKCTACGQPVLVPTTPPEPPAAGEESAEDAALRALTEGDDPEPTPRATSGYAGAAPSRPAAPPPPRDDTGSRAARALAAASFTEKATKPKAKAKSSGYNSSYDAPPERRWSPNWAKVGLGALGLVGGLTWLGLGLLVGRIWWYSLFLILAGPFIMINGFLSRSE